LSVKWRYYKYVFRYTPGPALEAVNAPYVTAQLPIIFDLSSDPHENFNLWSATLTMGWTLFPVLEIIGAYEKSVQEYPNIKPGEDFTGYKK
jgi:arylsulfatase